MKLTKDQLRLLRDLRDCKQRGGASQSCDRHRAVAHELEEMGLIKWHGEMFGSTFYYITDKGLTFVK